VLKHVIWWLLTTVSWSTTSLHERWCFSHTTLQRFEVLPDLLLPLMDWSFALPGAPLIVTWSWRFLPSTLRCTQVHLTANLLVQATLGFEHPGILVWQLPNTPRGSLWQRYILLILGLWEGYLEWLNLMWGILHVETPPRVSLIIVTMKGGLRQPMNSPCWIDSVCRLNAWLWYWDEKTAVSILHSLLIIHCCTGQWEM